jgi:hypothetical protein
LDEVLVKDTVDELRTCSDELTELLRPFVERMSNLEWRTEDGFVGLVFLCALRRQFDALQVVRAMADWGTCDKGVPLLRTACEELIWAAYLNSVDRPSAETLVFCKTLIDTEKTVRAQAESTDVDDMSALGFTPEWIEGMSRKAATAKKTVASIGKRLQWPKSRSVFPTTYCLAERAGKKKLYDLIYHATSRNVHFTPSELLRLAWGRGTQVRISSETLSRYWEAFVLFWGWRLFMLMAKEVAQAFEAKKEMLGSMDNPERVLQLIVQMGRQGRIPIITREEMNLHIKEGGDTLFS